MTELAVLQSEFAAAVLDRLRAPPTDVTSHTARHPMMRFNVYRNNVVASLTDVLQAYFPVVCRLVGEEFFRSMARHYICADPPRSPIISRYGDSFSHFICEYAPVQDLPYLADVARLEWKRQRAYHALDRAPIGAQDLLDVPAENAANLIFKLHPSASIIASRYPIVSIWKTNTHDEAVEPITLESEGEAALVVRPALRVEVLRLSMGSQSFVRALHAGVTVGEAANYAVIRDETFDFRFVFAGLLEIGAFASFEISGGTSRGERMRHEAPDRHLRGDY